MDVIFNNNIPIYIQIVDYIKTSIISEKLKSEEKIPTVREYAIYFKVNPNTIQKALTELEELGLIYTDSTNGKYVTKDKKLIQKIKKEYAKNIVNDFFKNMEKISINKEEAILYIKEKSDK